MPDEIKETQTQEPATQEQPTPTQPTFPTDLKPEQLQQMYAFYEEQNRKSQLDQLRSEWGDEFDDTHEQVRGYLETLPEDEQAIFNNVRGAILISKALRYDAMNSATVPGSMPPKMDGSSSVPPTGSKHKYSRSQIRAMSDKEYKEKEADIQTAYQQGQVLNDI